MTTLGRFWPLFVALLLLAPACDINTPKPIQGQLILKTETAFASIEVGYKDPSLDSGEPH